MRASLPNGTEVLRTELWHLRILIGSGSVDPQAYLADVLSRLVNRHPASQIDLLMPWAYANPLA